MPRPHASITTTLGLLFAVAHPVLAAPTIYLSQPNRIVKLEDRDSDGDYFDAGEFTLFAENLPAGMGPIVAGVDRLWVVVPSAATVLVLDDLNGDGDALDTGERSTFAVLAATPPAESPDIQAIGLMPNGALAIADAANGTILLATDLNHDGDARDFAETTTVADAFAQPTRLAPRSDGTILVVQNEPTTQLSILRDRNDDGDFFDFAENLTYADVLLPIAGLCAADGDQAWLAHTDAGTVTLLVDADHDGDALDPAETRLYADNLVAPTFIVRDPSTNDLYVVFDDSVSTLIRLRDANADGDALDVFESLAVAFGPMQVTGMAIAPPQSMNCAPGDANGDGTIDVADVPGFARALTGRNRPAPACPVDMNGDGRLDGRDIPLFLAEVIQ